MARPFQDVAVPRLPAAPSLVANAASALWLSEDGEIEHLSPAEAGRRAAASPPFVAHARAAARRLGLDRFAAYDLLELFAFVRPARFCRPTPRGLAEALGLPVPHSGEDEALALLRVAQALLEELARTPQHDSAAGIATLMGRGGWPWAPAVLAGLGFPDGVTADTARRAMQVWTQLKEWQAEAPEPQPGQIPVEPLEARRRLAELVGSGPVPAEPRPQQSDYASAVSQAFLPREEIDQPNLVLAEAGTGVGKTLGYLAPATLWAEKNHGPVWISTFTRQLQQQIDRELDRLHLDPATKARKVVVRKGRENYLCLLNLEDALGAMAAQPQLATALGLVARWVMATRDGDMQGGDFPGWLVDVLGRGRTLGLADRRGECVYSACPHYSKCFIEKSVRRARRAEIVIANHALVMIQAAIGGGDDATVPTRFVFDEGHHVFEAADNAFAGHLTGLETAELRRWVLGPEAQRSRARGLKKRLEDLLGADADAHTLLDQALQAARSLPGEAWPARVNGGTPTGPTEAFLALVRSQVYARAQNVDNPYSLETEAEPPVAGLVEAARTLDQALAKLVRPLEGLAKHLADKLDDEAAEIDSDTRRRLDALARGLKRRSANEIAGWRAMLASVGALPSPAHVDWFGIEREGGRDADVGMFRHWIDPTVPFAGTVGAQAHGLVVTSATLRDGTGDPEEDWLTAMQRTGAAHLQGAAIRAAVPSPFDYAAQTRALVVTDVRKDDLAQVAAAYRELFLAAGGGALGLFTAIQRLRAVQERIALPLEKAGLPLYAQHVDGMDVTTLVDIFRGEDDACLLGTDAVRDGVDVPGRSLRLIVFDRVPWPRPDILHRARRAYFDAQAGAKRYDDMLTRLRLRQAFGRLVRRADDIGVFVLLDPMMPSRLKGAFPEGVEVQRVGLAEAVAITRDFLRHPGLSPEAGAEDTEPA